MDCLRVRYLSVLIKSLVLLCGLFSASVSANEQAQQLIERMSQSAKTQDFKGYFTFERGRQSSSYFVAHKIKDNKQHQRLVFMDGQPLEIIKDGHSFQCIHAGGQQVQSEHGHLKTLVNLGQPKAKVWDYYSAETIGQQRVAGRETTRILLKPQDQHRYPFVFNVDNQSGIMVKMLVLDLKGVPLERFHFVNLELDNVEDNDLAPAMSDYKVVEHAQPTVVGAESKVDLEKWKLAWVPGGFERDGMNMKPWNSESEHKAFMYSDGLSAFSVFIEESHAENRASISKQLGSTAAISHYVEAAGKVFLITVVGEIPVMTAKQIASSVRFEL